MSGSGVAGGLLRLEPALAVLADSMSLYISKLQEHEKKKFVEDTVERGIQLLDGMAGLHDGEVAATLLFAMAVVASTLVDVMVERNGVQWTEDMLLARMRTMNRKCSEIIASGHPLE